MHVTGRADAIVPRRDSLLLADVAQCELPDPVDSEQAAAWAMPYGVNLSELVDRMGGSP